MGQIKLTNRRLCHGLGPAHAGALHTIFDEVLAGALDRATGNRPALGEVLVISHVDAVAIQIVGDPVQSFAFGAGQGAFRDALTNSLDHLAHLAEQNTQRPVQDPEIGCQAALGMEDLSGFPQFLQSVHQVQNQGDFQLPVNSNL